MKPATKKRLSFLASLLFCPVKNLDYFQNYYDQVNHIARNGLLQNRLCVNVFVLFQLVMMYKVIHFFYLGFISGHTDLENIVHFDAFYLSVQKAQINVISCIRALEALYLNRTMVLSANQKLLDLMRDVLLLRDWSFFLEVKFNGKNVCDQIRKCFIWSISVLMSLGLNGFVFYLIGCVYFWLKLYEHRDYFLSNSIVYLIYAICLNFLNGLAFLMFYFNFALMLSYNFCPMVTLVYMFYIKNVQCYRRLYSVIRAEQFSPFLYARYWRMYIQTLTHFFRINRMYGRLFFLLLISNCPRNVTFTVWLMNKGIPVYTQCLLVFWICYFGLFLFMIHLGLAFCTKMIHRPCKSMMRLMVRNDRTEWLTTSTRIGLSLNVFSLHTTNRYGFTYGDFGLVSLNTFAKFLLLYGKFILIFYKLMQNKVI